MTETYRINTQKSSSNSPNAADNQESNEISNTAVLKRVVVAGGYGVFGRWVSEALAADSANGLLELVIAGRNSTKACVLRDELLRQYPNAAITTLLFDVNNKEALHHQITGTFLLINCCGPFQNRDYGVAETCIACGSHYIDLADSRDFVSGISTIDSAAKAAGLSVISGASSVPGLSSAALKELCAGMKTVDSIDITIAPGNKAPRGEATVHSILLSAGQPIRYWQKNRWENRLGWFNHRRVDFGRAGHRWVANVDVPDLSLLPEKYHSVKSVHFQAGLELKLLHFGLFFLAAIARLTRRSFGFAARPLTRVASWFESWGSDVGAMKVTASGSAENGQFVTADWLLIAGSGDGPRIPTIASVILCQKLLGYCGEIPPSGAMPCMELFTEAEFRQAVAHLDIHCEFLH